MISKEVLKIRIETLLVILNISQEELATNLGYGKKYISEMFTPTGKITQKFVNALESKYGSVLNHHEAKTNPRNQNQVDGGDLVTEVLKKQNALLDRQNILLENHLTQLAASLTQYQDLAETLALKNMVRQRLALQSLARLERLDEGTHLAVAHRQETVLLAELKRTGGILADAIADM